jgi:diphthamide synthase (EF-2-diphthine--ammonia ligase)
VTVAVPVGAGNDVYEARLRVALDGVDTVAFGDLFLADLRAYREEKLAAAGKAAHFPLWGADTRALAEEFVAAGFRALVVSVDGEQLPHELLGRELDAAFLAALPPGADPCSENGEFHTFVHAGPVFSAPVAVQPGPRRGDGRFAWLEPVPA